jgi:hypothetical protein
MTYFRAFLAGFLSTLVFHQGVLFLLNRSGASPRKPWVLTPVPPLGIPSVVSLAFWGGLWGIALWMMIAGTAGARHWLLAIALGAILPTLVAFFVVVPLKHLPVAANLKPKIIVGALLLNGAWGAGVVVFMRLMARLRL